MALTTNGLNASADGLAGKVTHLSLHPADTADGTNENSTARQSAAWSPAAAGAVSLSAGDSFTGPANGAVAYVGLWDAATGGTFYGTVPVTTGDTTYNAAGDYTLDDLTVTYA